MSGRGTRPGGESSGDAGDGRPLTETDPDNNVVFRGVHWHRSRSGVMFYDRDSEKWVVWAPGVDAPPLPPRWQLLGVPTKVSRPAWRSPWRLIPTLLVVAAVLYAVYQGVAPSANQSASQAKQAQALVGKCLVANGTFDGHPRYSATPVSCSSAKAAAKVVSAIPSYPPGQLCPPGTVGVEIADLGAVHPYVECIRALSR